jgi:uncharacterized DUF497 family protein
MASPPRPPLYVWDEPKRLANLDAHLIDFRDADRFAWNEATFAETKPSRTGRRRFKAIGMLDRKLVAMIFSPLGNEAASIVSLRPASEKERELHASR